MKKHKTVLLTFDVEEFDTPLLHGISLSEADQLRIAKQGLERVCQVLQETNQPASTFYTTANYALYDTETIRMLAQQHEIASHTYYHTHFTPDDVLGSKNKLEELIAKPVQGFRMPNMGSFDIHLVKEAGYLYDSSVNPTYLPGKYNYTSSPIRPYWKEGIAEIPAAVVPGIRFPLFWLSFKNLPLSVYLALCRYSLHRTGLLNLYFHPWEFADLEGFKIPSFIIRPHGPALALKLKQFIQQLQTDTSIQFSTTAAFASQWIAENSGAS